MRPLSLPSTSALLAVLTACVLQQAGAQDLRLAEQSLHCSAVLLTLGQLQGLEADQATRLQQAAQYLLQVHASSAGVNMDKAHQSLTLHRPALQAPAQDQQRILREDAVVCGAWAEGFLAQGTTYRYVPVYPKLIAPGIRQAYGSLALQWLPDR